MNAAVVPLSSLMSLRSLRGDDHHDDDWPVLDRSALEGLPGRVVEAVDPYTEADPAAVLCTFLTAFGSAVGSGPSFAVGADCHRSNLFAVLVGQSSKARKGSSWSPIRALFALADPTWTETRIVSGLGSGEGLVHAVRDPLVRDGQTLDAGEPDKRALVLATEFSAVLRVISRQGSTLSPVLRDAWDRGDLRVTTKNAPIRATGAHVSILAHVTETELRRELTDTEAASGFGNRFLWIAVRRSKLLPEPDPFDRVDGLARDIRRALETARAIVTVERDADARALWLTRYAHLSRDRFGLAGSLTDRAEAQVVRLALLYALAAGSRTVRGEHLESALALWDYAERSADRLFGSATGDPLADEIETAVRRRGALTRTDIRDLFSRHGTSHRIETALTILVDLGRLRKTVIPTGGRPVERWEPTSEESDKSAESRGPVA